MTTCIECVKRSCNSSCRKIALYKLS